VAIQVSVPLGDYINIGDVKDKLYAEKFYVVGCNSK